MNEIEKLDKELSKSAKITNDFNMIYCEERTLAEIDFLNEENLITRNELKKILKVPDFAYMLYSNKKLLTQAQPYLQN